MALSGEGGLCSRDLLPVPLVWTDMSHHGREGRGKGGDWPPEAWLYPGAAPPTAESKPPKSPSSLPGLQERSSAVSPPALGDLAAESSLGGRKLVQSHSQLTCPGTLGHLSVKNFHSKQFITYFWCTDELKGGINFLSQLAIADLSFFVFVTDTSHLSRIVFLS